MFLWKLPEDHPWYIRATQACLFRPATVFCLLVGPNEKVNVGKTLGYQYGVYFHLQGNTEPQCPPRFTEPTMNTLDAWNSQRTRIEDLLRDTKLFTDVKDVVTFPPGELHFSEFLDLEKMEVTPGNNEVTVDLWVTYPRSFWRNVKAIFGK